MQAAAEGTDIVNTEVWGQEGRQDEAGDHCGRDQAGDGIQAQLCQTGKAGQQQRSKAEYRSQHAEANGGPEAADPVLRSRSICALPFVRSDCIKR